MIDLAPFRYSIAPRSELHPADWCALHVHLQGSADSSKYDPDQYRWWRKPMAHFADYETRTMVCLMPPGMGKSAFYEGILCWIISESPGPTLYITQTNDTAATWLETRAKKTFRKCEPLAPLWPMNERNAFRKDAMIWPHMFVLVGGASRSNLQEVSIQYGLGDESWTWGHGMMREFKARSHNRANRKFVFCSQAGFIAAPDSDGQTSELHLEHDTCQKWDFAWQCPECDHVHPFSFDQMAWDEVLDSKGKPDDQATVDTVRRVCPECAAEFPDTDESRRMLTDSYKENEGYLLVEDKGMRGNVGFHVDQGANWRWPWATDVLAKILADRQAELGDYSLLEKWTQKNRAKGYGVDQAITPIEIKASGYNEHNYAEGQKIENEEARFMTIDAGLDHWWVVIRAWATGGSSKLLHAGYVGREQDLVALEEKYCIPKMNVFKDIGYRQTDMADIIARNGWRGIKGKFENGDNFTQLFDWEIKLGPKKGETEQRLYSKKKFTKSKGGKMIEFYHMSTEKLQYVLQRLIDGQGAEWLCYDDAPPLYATHLNGEFLGTDKNARGREVKKWKRRGANHMRDCEIMNLCAAFMFKIFRATPVQEQESDSEG